LEDEFADNKVVIVLTKEASLNFKTYSPEDFPEAFISRVDDSTKLTMELVSKQLEAEKTGDWSELRLHIENNMLPDIDNFRRILDLTLTNPGKENVLMAIKLLERRGDVFYAGPDFFFELQALPNPLPSNYYDDGVDANNGYYYSQSSIHNLIKLPQAWDIATGSPFVLVGVLDTGIDASHLSISNRIHPSLNRNFTNPSFPNGLAANPPQDVLGNYAGHGSMIAGVIAGNAQQTGSGNQGVIGVNWNVTLVSLKVYDSTSSSLSSRIRYAIDFATSQAIPILNCSCAHYNYDASQRTSIRIYPGLFVSAAGNEGRNTDVPGLEVYPGSYNLPNLINVGLSDLADTRVSYSNWGKNNVDIFAPGWGLFGVNINLPTGFSSLSGTSIATPLVTGVAALIRAASGNNIYLDASSIKKIILRTIDKGTELSSPNALNGFCVTNGRLNAEKALDFTVNSWRPCLLGCANQQDFCIQSCKDDCYESIVMDPGCLLNPGLCQVNYGHCLSVCETPYLPCVMGFNQCVAGCS